jgi:hypothetical protein
MSPQSSHHTVDTASWITLRWTRGTRYYRAHLEQELWHGWWLTLVHRRIGTRLGRARASSSRPLEAALTSLAAVTKRRRQRGYDLTN